MRRRALLALLASAPLLPTIARAQDAALSAAANETVQAFLKALRNEKMDEAMQYVDAPFVAEDAQIFATEAEVKAYLTAMCLELPAAEMPNEVLAILDEKINMFELVVGEIDSILGEMSEDEDFAELVFRAWVGTTEETRPAAFAELGEQMAEARAQYERVKALDEEIFGEDFIAV